MASDHTSLDALDDALTAVRRAMQRPDYRRRLLGGRDVPGGVSTVRVLRVVERSDPDAPSIGDVAESMAIDPSTASRLVDTAVEAGYLTRRPCEDDRRRSRLELTRSGRALLADVTATRRQVLAEVTDGWSAADRGRLVGLLQRLHSGFDAFRSPG